MVSDFLSLLKNMQVGGLTIQNLHLGVNVCAWGHVTDWGPIQSAFLFHILDPLTGLLLKGERKLENPEETWQGQTKLQDQTADREPLTQQCYLIFGCFGKPCIGSRNSSQVMQHYHSCVTMFLRTS